jgi:heme oxygenase
MSVRKNLKEFTWDIHQKLDKKMSDKYFGSPLDAHSYTNLLSRYLYTYESILLALNSMDDGELKPYLQGSIRNLKKDLNTLGKDGHHVSVDLNNKVHINTKDDLLGLSYVVYGSSMGGRLMSKMAQKENLPTHFFDGDSLDPIGVFQGFLKRLERDTSNINSVCHQAEKTFHFFEENLV